MGFYGPEFEENEMSKKKRKTLQSKAQMFALEGSVYCKNYDVTDATCLSCCQNNEGPYRAGCFRRVDGN